MWQFSGPFTINYMKKKLIVLLFVAFIFVGCRKPIITLVDQEPPRGYSKVFLLEDNYFTKSSDMEDFVNKFKDGDDLVFKLNDFDYIILRK